MYNLYLNIFNKIGLPEILAQLSWPLIPFIGVAVLLIIVVLFLVLMERKVLAILTIRKGPNRVGPYGLFQTIADAIKLLVKEDIMGKETNKILFTLAPVVVFVPTMIIYGLLPYTGNLFAVNIAAGLFMILAISSVSIIGIVIAGWASNNKYSLLGGMRSAAQAISYEVPLFISAISVAILAGSMNMADIVGKQSGGLVLWNMWPSIIGFVVFFICSIAEVNRIPFDLPEAESELVSGYNTEYTGMKFALFFLAEYAALFIMSVLIVTLFLGGYSSPFGVYISKIFCDAILHNQAFLNLFVGVEQAFWLIFKTYTVIFAIMWIRATLPRLKADQLMAFSWKFLLPLSLLNLVIVAVYRYFIPG
jgi:NADH-quinone oxidoreductase subunit H